MKKQKKKNPLLEKKYQEGYDVGFHEAQDRAVSTFAVRIERLEQVSGIGEKTIKKIIESINSPITDREWEKVSEYMDIQKQKRRGK